MKNVKIFGTIVATIFATFLLLSIPGVSAVQYTAIKDSMKKISIPERVEIVKKILKIKYKTNDGTSGTILNYLAYLVALFLFTLFIFISRNIWGIRPF
ncbi:MAG: hypothetical protein NT038_10935 [Euryarchaeota archaeon]|nr:hypothetical protein [Euryarchaeota archaeon]